MFSAGEHKTLILFYCAYMMFFTGVLCAKVLRVIMVQSRGLGRRLGVHRSTSVAAERNGRWRYAQNATNKAQKNLKNYDKS